MFWFMLGVAVAVGAFVWWKVGFKEGIAAMAAGAAAAITFFSDLIHSITSMF